MKIGVALYYSSIEKGFGDSNGENSFAYRHLEPVVALKKRLTSLGHEFFTRAERPLSDADVVLFWDSSPELNGLADSLSQKVPCLLISMESPMYCPESHQLFDLLKKRWSAVMTWNRSYSGDQIYHYDLPSAGRDRSTPQAPLAPRTHKGVVISTFTEFRPLGVVSQREKFFIDLAEKGLIEIYGRGWPKEPERGLMGYEPNKLETLCRYRYAIACENEIYPGYVTEKLMDCIAAGMPSMYHGDFATAERRFPGAFIPLKSLTNDSFRDAREKMNQRYGELRTSIEVAAKDSLRWCDSFVETVERALNDVMSNRLKLAS